MYKVVERGSNVICSSVKYIFRVFLDVTATNGGVVGEGQELSLNCHVTGSPVPNLMWSLEKNNEVSYISSLIFLDEVR